MKPEIKYGLLAALFLIVWLLMEYWLGFHTRFSFLSLLADGMGGIVMFTATWLSLREKTNDLGRNMSFREFGRQAVNTSFVTLLFYLPFLLFYNYKFNALWVENLVAWGVEHPEQDYLIRFFNPAPQPEVELLSNTETHIALLTIYLLFCSGVATIFGFIRLR